MKSCFTAWVHGRAWYLSLIRIALLSAVSWGALEAADPKWNRILPAQGEWSRTDFSKSIVDPREIESGGPGKDGIPAIDRPRFVSPAEADRWLDPREPVIALEIAGQARAYPLSILIYHEIVNDTVGGTPVAVTFCPLCNASIVFDRRVDGRPLDFGTTGRLRKSDLVMYDRRTESWWQQFTGQGIVGHYAGARLIQVPSHIVAYEDFKAAYRGGRVLSRETGHSRPYGRNPYRGYDRIGDQPFLFRDPADSRLPPMERVISVTSGATQKIYPFSALSQTPVINDEIAGLPVVILSKAGTLSVLDEETIRASRTIPSATAFDRRISGRILHFEWHDGGIRDRETGSAWNLFGQAIEGPLRGRRLASAESGVHFAFAWLAFNPASEIYRPPSK